MHVFVLATVVTTSVFASFAPQGASTTPDRSLLRAGNTAVGEVTAESPVVRTETLGSGGYSHTPVRGVEFELVIDETETFSIDLRSYLFDAYLVLVDASGRVVAEDDDGLLGSHARIVREFEAGTYRLWACALHAERGEFEITVQPGAPEMLTGTARADAAIEDTRRALEIRERVLGAEHPDTVRSVGNLAFMLRDRGRYAEAELLYQRALEVRERLLGADHPDTAETLNDLGRLYRLQNRLPEAESLYRRALEIRERRLGSDDRMTAQSLGNLAFLLVSQHRYLEAEPLARRCLEVRDRVLGSDHGDTANSCIFLGQALMGQGRYAEAEPFFRRALETAERRRGAWHPDLGVSHGSLGRVLLNQGRYSEAEPHLRRALEISERADGPDSVATAAALTNLAVVWKYQGRLAEAESMLRRAIQIHDSAPRPDHDGSVTVLGNLAVLLGAQGRHAEAEPLARRALELLDQQYGPEHPKICERLCTLAKLEMAEGRYAEAQRLLERAVEVSERRLGREHPTAANSLRWTATLLLNQERYAESLAIRERLCDALQAWVWRELAASPRERRFDIAASLTVDVQHLLDTWTHLDPAPDLDRVYRHFCAWKGLVFRHAARIGRILADRSRADPEAKALRERLDRLDSQISSLAYAEAIPDPDSHFRRIDELRAERRDAEVALLRRLGVEPRHEETSGAELARLLPEHTALLDFATYHPFRRAVFEAGRRIRAEHRGAARSVCFVTVAGASGPKLVDLGATTKLDAAVEAYLDQIAPRLRGARVRVAEDDPAETLRRLLFEPLATSLAGVRRLIVIPDGVLGELPFGALPTGGGRYLIEDCDVVYATDPVTLRDLLDREPTPWDATASLLAVGAVDYEVRGDRSEPAAPPAGPALASSRGAGGFSRHWGVLASTGEEVRTLESQARRMFGTSVDPMILTGAAATEEAVKANAAGRAILHIASHGFFQRDGLTSLWQAALARGQDDDEPRGIGALSDEASVDARDRDPFAGLPPLEGVEPGLLAGLVLAGANLEPAEDRDDGVLTAAEVADLDLSACRLAVLSACQTALGTGQSGEGLQSLRRAFQEAGAESVVATLWKVDDEQAQRLMHGFYTGLWEDGLSRADALRRAKLELLRDPATKAPRYWAAFTLSGEWR